MKVSRWCYDCRRVKLKKEFLPPQMSTRCKKCIKLNPLSSEEQYARRRTYSDDEWGFDKRNRQKQEYTRNRAKTAREVLKGLDE